MVLYVAGVFPNTGLSVVYENCYVYVWQELCIAVCCMVLSVTAVFPNMGSSVVYENCYVSSTVCTSDGGKVAALVELALASITWLYQLCMLSGA